MSGLAGHFTHAAAREECLLLAHPRRSGSSSSRGQSTSAAVARRVPPTPPSLDAREQGLGILKIGRKLRCGTARVQATLRAASASMVAAPLAGKEMSNEKCAPRNNQLQTLIRPMVRFGSWAEPNGLTRHALLDPPGPTRSVSLLMSRARLASVNASDLTTRT